MLVYFIVGIALMVLKSTASRRKIYVRGHDPHVNEV